MLLYAVGISSWICLNILMARSFVVTTSLIIIFMFHIAESLKHYIELWSRSDKEHVHILQERHGGHVASMNELVQLMLSEERDTWGAIDDEDGEMKSVPRVTMSFLAEQSKL